MKEKHSVYITYESRSTGGEICAGEENDSWPNREPEEIDVYLKDLMLADEYPFHGSQIEVNFDPTKYIGRPLYVVFVRYTTGDTFGHSTGNPCFPACFTKADPAFKMEEQIRNDKYEGYAPWKGYFESLDSVEVVVKRLIDERWNEGKKRK